MKQTTPENDTAYHQLGAHPGVPFREYLEWNLPSSHDLGLIRRSPAHYAEAKTNPRTQTPAMAFGSAAHTWILEGMSAVSSSISIAPKVDRRTKAGKLVWADFKDEAESMGKTIISEADSQTIAAMDAAIQASPAGRGVLGAAPEREVSCVWQAEGGLVCRGRPDAYGPKVVVDLKTCQDASAGEFGRTAARYGYHAQAAFYLDGMRGQGIVDKDAVFVFLAVEKESPYGVGVYVMDERQIEAGRARYAPALALYRQCRDSGEWPSYEASQAIAPLKLPIWAMDVN